MCGTIKIDELTTTQIIKLIRKNNNMSDNVNNSDNNNEIIAVGHNINLPTIIKKMNINNNYSYFGSQQRQQQQLCKHERMANLIDVFDHYNTLTGNCLDNITFDRLSCVLTQFSLHGLRAETQL